MTLVSGCREMRLQRGRRSSRRRSSDTRVRKHHLRDRFNEAAALRGGGHPDTLEVTVYPPSFNEAAALRGGGQLRDRVVLDRGAASTRPPLFAAEVVRSGPRGTDQFREASTRPPLFAAEVPAQEQFHELVFGLLQRGRRSSRRRSRTARFSRRRVRSFNEAAALRGGGRASATYTRPSSRSFNEAAALRGGGHARRASPTRPRWCFNEAAALRGGGRRVRCPPAGGCRRFNEAAALRGGGRPSPKTAKARGKALQRGRRSSRRRSGPYLMLGDSILALQRGRRSSRRRSASKRIPFGGSQLASTRPPLFAAEVERVGILGNCRGVASTRPPLFAAEVFLG